MIGIVDYGMGNVRSLFNAFEYIGCDVFVSGDPNELRRAERLLLPGVGAFGDAMAVIRERGLDQMLEEEVLKAGKPMLGICLGMQMLAKKSTEHGEHDGLGWLDASVVRFDLPAEFKVPHIGWNDLQLVCDHPLFQGLGESPSFYFVHSFHMQCLQLTDVLATCDYGIKFTAAVHRNNIIATQFHPEKSQDNGLKVLENFLSWQP